MAVKFGFFDSLNGDRLYNANDVSTMFEGIFSDGVFELVGNKFQVTDNPGTMSILVKDGRAWFNNLWIRNTSTLVLSIAPSHPALNRKDLVILEFDSSITVRENSIKVLTGVASSTPIPPVLANTATLKQYAIAEIFVSASVTEILSGNITNKVGTVNTPYANSLVYRPTTTALNDFQMGNGSGGWIKKTLTEAATVLRTILDSAYSQLNHSHSGSDITSGTIAAGRLPNPTTTAIGGVKRNAGTANQYVNGIDSVGNLTYGTPSGAAPSIQSYTPVWTNLTVGNGTIVAMYTVNGKRCSGNICLTVGSTTSIAANPMVTVPIAFHTSLPGYTTLGAVALVDYGTNLYMGEAIIAGTNILSFRVINVAGTYAIWTYVGAATPHTWGVGDQICIEFDYLIN